MRYSLLLFVAAMLLPFGSAPRAAEEPKAVMAWVFDKPGDTKGWRPNNHLGKVRVEAGELRGETTDWDPFFTSPRFEIAATPWQWVEIRIRSSKAGRGQLFFSNTMDSPYDGFSPEKQVAFDLAGGNEWQTLRILPFWHAEKKIIQMRLDFFAGMEFAIGSIKILENEVSSTLGRKSAWNFAGGAQGWVPFAGVSEPVTSGKGIAVTVKDSTGLLRSPALSVPIDDRMWVAVRMRAAKGSRATLVWATSAASGLQETTFPLRPDGQFHTYNVEVGANSKWDGSLLTLALRPSHSIGDQVEIESISLEQDAIGPADLELIHFGMDDAINRVGMPCALTARFVNLGAETARGVKAVLTLPKGVTARPQAATGDFVFEHQIPGEFRFVLTATQPVDGVAKLRLTGPGAPPGEFTAKVRITPPLKVQKATVVPEPRPAKTKYLIGAYYFPGWESAAKWECIERVAPIRKPVLGYYDESKPEIADWQIKWAVEHGINFFLVDWYWSAGSRSLEHWLHNAYMKSRYRKHLQWAVMWANHNAPNTHSREDWVKVTQYWIDNYFSMPEYLRIDGKPVVYIWAPGNIRRDMGGTEKAAELLALSQEMAKKAGYPGITFAAMNAGGSVAEAKTLAAEGYTSNATYHWWADAPNKAADSRHFPFSLVADRSRQGWESREKALKEAGVGYVPTADTGWDSRPWHGDRAMVIDGRTPAQFERLLREAKSYLDARGQKMLILGPLNEWGEGSYIEPCVEYGFEMYDAVRRVFCDEPEAHTDLAPVDVGMGPYDFPMSKPSNKTVWQFDTPAAEGWAGLMGMRNVQVKDGALYGITQTADPALSSPALNFRAQEYRYVVIRMKAVSATPKGEQLQLFWGTSTRGIAEASSTRTAIQIDGKWHTYVVPVGDNPRWRGVIRNFRLDPCSTANVELWIDEIRLAKEKPAQVE